MKLIGIGGYAKAGKDAFVSIARNILTKNSYSSLRLAFADELKKDIDPFLKEKYGISAFTIDPKEKEIIRPFLVAHGCGKRLQTEGKYWIDKVDKQIQNILERPSKDQYHSDHDVIFISDCRFKNESEWIHKKWNGHLIHIKRWKYEECRDGYGDSYQGRVYDKAPNDEEEKNDPIVQQTADIKLEWQSQQIPAGEDVTKNKYLQEIVLYALNSVDVFKHKT